MRSQLAATPQPFGRRLLREIYWRLLALWFGRGKAPWSRLVNLFRRKAPWPSHPIRWQTVDDFAEELPNLVRWKSDPLGGAFDTFLNREVMAERFRRQGIMEKDCDGLALFTACNLEFLLHREHAIYLVTIILDPFSFAQQPLLYSAHVLCVFRHQGGWRASSNETLYPEVFESFTAAVQHNPYCQGHPILWFEVRDLNLRCRFAGRNLADFDPSA